jgi:hypothetical protein
VLEPAVTAGFATVDIDVVRWSGPAPAVAALACSLCADLGVSLCKRIPEILPAMDRDGPGASRIVGSSRSTAARTTLGRVRSLPG